MLQLEQPCCLIPGHSSAATGHLESMSTTVLLSVPQISLLSMRLMLCRERGCLGQLRAGEKTDSRRKGEGGVCVFFFCGQWRWQQHNNVPPQGLSPVHAGCDLAGALSGPAVATGPVSSLSSWPRAGSGSHCVSATCCQAQFFNFLQNLAWREQGASTEVHPQLQGTPTRGDTC